MKIRPVRAELFHVDGRTDGQTDTMKLIVAFRSFAHVTNKELGPLSRILLEKLPVPQILRGLSSRANYTDRAPAAGRRS
jgi:hypothetical protein